MRREWFPLDKIKVAAPCTADWQRMYGNDRVRFCGQCNQNVYNLSALTREQAEDLIRRQEGRLCVRFFRRKDGTVITNNCPVGLRALKAKYNSTKATILKAAISFLAYLGVLWWVEGPPIFRSVQGAVDFPADVGKLAILDAYAAPRTITKSESFIREKAIYKVVPIAHLNGGPQFKGDAVVKISISPTGKVDRATLISGPQSIKAIAEGAALKWEFEPMTEGGLPVRVDSTLTFRFGGERPESISRPPLEERKACPECL